MPSAPRPTNCPARLPQSLLPNLLRRRKLILFLDYDGTISEIVAHPHQAKPLPRASELVAALAACPERIQLAIVSGRALDDLIGLLKGEDNLVLAGTHGLEVMEPGGRRWPVTDLRRFAAELKRTRDWLDRHVPPSSGFLIEDKQLAIALHYRNADRAKAAAVCQRFEEFVERRTGLAIGRGKQVVEAMPPEASKGAAVRLVLQRYGQDAIPVYFGDDNTDEEAFFALRNDGITVLVSSSPKKSWAKYRVNGPAQVVEVLDQLTAALDASGDEPAA